MVERIAVTGGSGFIGSYVEKELLSQDYRPIIIDTSRGDDIAGKDWTTTREKLRECQTVIHLAGVLGTEELFSDVERAIDVNIKGTARILKCCADFHMSYVGITMPQVWDNIYQATKLASQRLASAYHRHYGVGVSHVRAFNAFGPGQKVGSPQKIIPTFASRAWSHEPIPVWGDGQQLVDLIYVADIAKILVAAMNFRGNTVVDAGTAQGMTVNSVAEHILSITGSKAGIKYLPMRKGEHGPGVLSTGEGWNMLGWRPTFRIGDFEKTVRSYIPSTVASHNRPVR